MPDHPNATLVRDALEKMATGSMSEQADLLADDVEWHEIGRDEPIRGKEALMARFGEMPEGGSITLDVHDVLANDDHTVALVTATAKMGEQSLTYRTAEITHIRDGKIAHRWAFSDDTERITKFFAPSMG
jgi:ketosteroid isomerase-like protein